MTEATPATRRTADDLMALAARISVSSPFGWTHPDCVTLQEAARILRGEPVPVQPDIIEGVLS